MLGALQRSEDIAQSDVVCRRRQFETASRTEPSADAVVIGEKSLRTTTGLEFALSATSSERKTLPGLAARAVSK